MPAGGVSAHTKVDEHTGEMLVFNYSEGRAVHALRRRRRCRRPRALHAGPAARSASPPRHGLHVEVRDPQRPAAVLGSAPAGEGRARAALLPRHAEPEPPKNGNIFRYLDLNALQTVPHRWRFNLATGQTKEEDLSDTIMEFGMVSGANAGRPYRYTYNMTGVEGWFLFDGVVKQDVLTGTEQRYAFDDGVFASETPFAPRPNARSEDDGYLVTFTTDMNNDASECAIFDAADITAGPVARVRLPERISSGTHSCWMRA